jgi:hypothetical protein
MTIALGSLCAGGLIVAADTAIVLSDGSKAYGMKVQTKTSATGCYVLANCSEDGNAANTLGEQILTALEGEDPQTLSKAEKVVTKTMTQWSCAYMTGHPATQLVFGVFINKPENFWQNTGGGLGLYFCEPPNTILRKQANDDSRGYTAIGTGSAVTDPLYKTLFSNLNSASGRLRDIAYLMYRAKRDNAYCDGYTTAVLLKNEYTDPIRITPLDMQVAENTSNLLDFVLRPCADAVLTPRDDEAFKKYSEFIVNLIHSNSARFAALKFHSLQGEEII